MTIKTEYGERTYEYVIGHAWQGAKYSEGEYFPFATGRVSGAWQEPSIANPENTFEATRNLISWHTEKFAGKYAIYERIEGQDNRRYIGATLTVWGAKRKIAKRVSDVTNRLADEMTIAKFNEGRSTQ